MTIATKVRTKSGQVSIETLEKLGACKEQVELFRQTFPDGADYTEANVLRAVAAGLNVDWFGKRVVAAESWRAYEDATTEAWNAHEREKRPTRAVYDKEVTAALLVVWRTKIKAAKTNASE
jgi:hypothetical protein